MYALELLGLLALVAVEYLSGYRGGLMKHLYFRKMEYMFSLYSPQAVVVHTLVSLLMLLMVGTWVWRCYQHCIRARRCLYRMSLYCLVLWLAFYWPAAQTLAVYPYGLIFLELLVLVEGMTVIRLCTSNCFYSLTTCAAKGRE